VALCTLSNLLKSGSMTDLRADVKCSFEVYGLFYTPVTESEGQNVSLYSLSMTCLFYNVTFFYFETISESNQCFNMTFCHCFPVHLLEALYFIIPIKHK
jgi:hypothetical protein